MKTGVIDTLPAGFVKLPRALLSQGWTRKPGQLALFVRLLTMAAREPFNWQGLQLERGQVATSLRSLSTSCGLTVSEVRTALEGLSREGIAHKLTHKIAHDKGELFAHKIAHGYTIISICEFDNYEGVAVEVRTQNRTQETGQDAHKIARKFAISKEYKEIDIIKTVVNDSNYWPIVSDWLEYKRERGEAYKGRRGVTQFYNRLRELSCGDLEAARRIVSAAMANNYAGIYPEKASTAPGTQRQSSRPNPRITLGETNPNDYKSTI